MEKINFEDALVVEPAKVEVLDEIPVGTIIDYDGDVVPDGYVKVSDPNAYSTEEQVIGIWVDGKPLYRRVVIASNIGTATTINLPNIKTIINFGGYFSSGESVFPVNMPLGEYGHTACFLNTNTSNLHIDSSYNIDGGYVILEYTKTTD